MELKGTTAVITGSSGHLGGQIALALGAAGCNCVCHYHSGKEKVVKVAGQIQDMGVEAVAVGGDLRDSGKIEEMFAKAAKLGTPRILINSAAIFSRQPLQRQVRQHLPSPFLIQLIYFVEQMLEVAVYRVFRCPYSSSLALDRL